MTKVKIVSLLKKLNGLTGLNTFAYVEVVTDLSVCNLVNNNNNHLVSR
ncbi:hypothetical protein [Paenibacillus sp. FSL K6-2524]